MMRFKYRLSFRRLQRHLEAVNKIIDKMGDRGYTPEMILIPIKNKPLSRHVFCPGWRR